MKKNLRWIYLATGTVALLFAGIIYAWSILKVPFSENFGWSDNDLATVFMITLSSFCLGCIFGGFQMRRLGVRKILLIGALLSSSGFFIVSRIDGSRLFPLFIGYGLLAGAGIGIVYNCILAVIDAWFPDKKGLSMGILMMGFGASTMLLGNIASLLIATPTFGWRRLFFAFALCIGTILCIAAFVLRLPPNDDPSCTNAAERFAGPTTNYSPGAVLRRKSFWLLFLAMALLGSVGTSVIGFSRDFSLSVGINAQTAALLVGVLSIANGVGRILAGFLYDLFHRRFIMAYVGILAVAACFVCILAIVNRSAVLCTIGLILAGLSYGSNTFSLSAVMNAYYGSRYFPQNLSLGLLVMLPSSFLAKLATALYTATSSYLVPFVVMGAYSIAALILNLNNNRA